MFCTGEGEPVPVREPGIRPESRPDPRQPLRVLRIRRKTCPLLLQVSVIDLSCA
jgi:hypothetical protein